RPSAIEDLLIMTPFRWILLSSLYVTQFLSLGFFLIALVGILRREGMSLDQLGIIYALGLVWVVKVLWAPLVDRVRVAKVGHYRFWLLLTQTGMVATLLVMAQFDVVAEFWAVFALCTVVACLSATQDIAADGLACQFLSHDNRSIGSGVQTAGGLLGNVIGGGGVLMLYPTIGWSGCMVVLAVGVALPLTLILWLREPEPGEPAVTCGQRVSLTQLWRFWRRPGGVRWAAILLSYPLAIGMAYALLTPILVDIGWSLERIGFAMNIVGAGLGMVAACGAGWLIRRFGRRHSLVGMAAVQAVALLLLLMPVNGLTGAATVIIAISTVFVLYGALHPVLMTVMMDRASAACPGTDFTIQYSTFMFASFVAGGVALPFASSFGYALTVILVSSTAVVVTIVAALCYDDDGERGMAVAT
ncbi:MAG: MFS transporter, partial [Pseudomonadota bacterium]